MKKKYAAVIVTYQPDAERVRCNTENLRHQGFFVIIVDNGSENVNEIRESAAYDRFIDLKMNKGIAAALNEGMRAAVNENAAWTLSLDQDTQIAENLLEEYQKYTALKNAGALCPAIDKRGEGFVGSRTKKIEKTQKCPTSGFFMSTEAWKKVGEYDEWMFIDYVDYDMCTRLRIAGYQIYRVNTTHIIQELGKRSVNSFFFGIGKKLGIKKLQNFAVTYNHSPFRNYYFVRNSLYYIDKYKDVLNTRQEYAFVMKWELKKLLLEKNKTENFRALKRGVRDYKCKKKGKVK